MPIWGVKDCQEYLGTSRAETIKILSMKNCPTMQRRRGQNYRIFDEDLKDWVKFGGLQQRR